MVIIRGCDDDGYIRSEPDDDGDWVDFGDHLNAVAELERTIEKLRADLKSARDELRETDRPGRGLMEGFEK